MSEFICKPPEGTQARPCMKWIWMNSENLPIAEFRHILFYAAKKFHDTVGWCCVYSPNLYEATAKRIMNSVEEIVAQCESKFGMADSMEQAFVQREEMDWMLQSANVPEGDEENLVVLDDDDEHEWESESNM